MLDFKGYCYFYTIIYGLAIFVYTYGSNIYNLSDYSLGDDYEMKMGDGLVLMYASGLIALTNIIFIVYIRLMRYGDLNEPLIR